MVAIHSEILRTLRKRRRLSQQALAEATRGRNKVGVATIKRIEAADGEYEAHSRVAEALAQVLHVSAEDLAKAPQDRQDLLHEACALGYRVLNQRVRAENALSFDMVEHLYGVPVKRQIAMAPLLFALMAEASLAWRRKRLAEFNTAAETLRSLGEGHLSFSNAVHRAEDAAAYEQESINMHDLFGRHASDDAYNLGYDPNTNNPFVDYLRAFAKRIDSENLQIEIDPDLFNELPEYSLGERIIEETTGGDRQARYAMSRGHVKVKDVPENLLGEDKKEERIAWMVSRIPGKEREAMEEEDARWTSLLSDL